MCPTNLVEVVVLIKGFVFLNYSKKRILWISVKIASVKRFWQISATYFSWSIQNILFQNVWTSTCMLQRSKTFFLYVAIPWREFIYHGLWKGYWESRCLQKLQFVTVTLQQPFFITSFIRHIVLTFPPFLGNVHLPATYRSMSQDNHTMPIW